MRSRHANGRAPDRLAPLCPRGQDLGARHRVEHLHQVRALAQRCERIEKGLKDAGSAQPPKAFPDRIPMAELRRKGAPGDVVDRKIMQRLQKLPVVPSFRSGSYPDGSRFSGRSHRRAAKRQGELGPGRVANRRLRRANLAYGLAVAAGASASSGQIAQIAKVRKGRSLPLKLG